MIDSFVTERPHILFVVPWTPYPLHSGGSLRAFHIAAQLSITFDVELLVPISSNEQLQALTTALQHESRSITVSFVEAPTRNRGLLERVQQKILTVRDSGSWYEPVNSLGMALRQQVKRRLSIRRPDLLLLTELESLHCGYLTRNLAPEIPIVVDMHNVNHRLFQRVRDQHQSTTSQTNKCVDLQGKESKLHGWADYCFACSSDDLNVLLSCNPNRLRGFVVPNGVDTDLCRYQRAEEKAKTLKNLIFCASLTTEANIGGLLWFHDKVWPRLQQMGSGLSLTVVGNDPGDSRLDRLRRDKSLRFTGRVHSLEVWYAAAGVAICPILAGSGTRLKILEAMSFGNPVVSTPIGCEGLQALDNHHLLIRDTPEAFGNGILELINQPERFRDLSLNARKFVDSRYDWNVIGRRLSEIIGGILTDSSRNGVGSGK